MRRPSFRVHEYKHSKTHKFYINLRAFGKGRKFFKTRSEAEAEAMRQRALMERHGREAVGFSKGELSEFIEAKQTISAYGETIRDAVKFRVDHLERVRRHGITVAHLVDEVLEAKRRDGRSELYLRDLRYRLNKYCPKALSQTCQTRNGQS